MQARRQPPVTRALPTRQIGGGARPVLSAAAASSWAGTLQMHLHASLRMRAVCAPAGAAHASPAPPGGRSMLAESAPAPRPPLVPAPALAAGALSRTVPHPTLTPSTRRRGGAAAGRGRGRARARLPGRQRAAGRREGRAPCGHRRAHCAWHHVRLLFGAPRPGRASPRALRRARACGCCWGGLLARQRARQQPGPCPAACIQGH